MNKLFAILTIAFASFQYYGLAQSSMLSPATIDQGDTVFYDLNAATVIGSIVEFPVYYRSDDQVVALDFNFKYNHNKLDFDTIVKLANYLDVLSFYNSNDSTVRLTSYTNTLFYPNDSLLFKVRFTVLQPGALCSGDIYAVNSLLNGDVCSSGIIDCTSGLIENDWLKDVSIYPNPTNDVVQLIGLPIEATLELHDALGNSIVQISQKKYGSLNQLNVGHLPAGVYNVLIRNGKTVGHIPLVKVD